MRVSENEHTGSQPVYYSAWNGQPTLRVTDVPKSDVCKVKVKAENVQVKLEHAAVKLEHADDGSDGFQYMSQECCDPADLPAKPFGLTCTQHETLSPIWDSI